MVLLLKYEMVLMLEKLHGNKKRCEPKIVMEGYRGRNEKAGLKARLIDGQAFRH
jgi:hypothetical protein